MAIKVIQELLYEKISELGGLVFCKCGQRLKEDKQNKLMCPKYKSIVGRVRNQTIKGKHNPQDWGTYRDLVEYDVLQDWLITIAKRIKKT